MADDRNPTRANESDEMGQNADEEVVGSSDETFEDVDELDAEDDEDLEER